MKNQKRITSYRFEDKKQLLYATIIGSFILGLILLFPNLGNWAYQTHAFVCLITGGLVWGLKKGYHWKSKTQNLAIVMLYLSMVAIEWLWFGLPAPAIAPPQEGYKISKGFMIDLFAWGLPLVYYGLRVVLVWPLVNLVRNWE